MGTCGCGETYGDYLLHRSGAEAITIELYDGCRYCETPAGVILRRFQVQDDDPESKIVLSLPEVPWVPTGLGPDAIELEFYARPFLSLGALKYELKEAFLCHPTGDPVDDAMIDALVDRELFDAVIARTRDEQD